MVSGSTSRFQPRLALSRAKITIRAEASKLSTTGKSFRLLRERYFLRVFFLNMMLGAESVKVRDSLADIAWIVARRLARWP